MCGLAGFSNVKDSFKRECLVWSLGLGIDRRGGDAAGYVALGTNPVVGRKVGLWASASYKFLSHAASAATTLMHARWKTCGRGGKQEAHPFTVQRDGEPVLWGAHNGVIYDAEFSARINQRSYDVDSRELFELLADNDLSGIQDMNGYGVITWVERRNPSAVLVARLSSSSEFYAVRTECDAIVWGSTRTIVEDACDDAEMVIKAVFQLTEVGRVYSIEGSSIFMTKREGVKLADYRYSWLKEDDDDISSEWWQDYTARLERDG